MWSHQNHGHEADSHNPLCFVYFFMTASCFRGESCVNILFLESFVLVVVFFRCRRIDFVSLLSRIETCFLPDRGAATVCSSYSPLSAIQNSLKGKYLQTSLKYPFSK